MNLNPMKPYMRESQIGWKIRGWKTVLVVLLMSPAIGMAQVGQFETVGDVGAPKLAGSTTYDADAQTYLLSAAGTNLWEQRDEFQFASLPLAGDFILQAGMQFLGEGVHPHRKGGWIVRADRSDDAPYVSAAVHGDGLIALQFRRAKGAITEQVESPVKGADFIQLERRGETFLFSAARHGEPWQTVEVAGIPVGEAPDVGLFLCSHDIDVVEQAVFRNVRLIRPAPPDFVPYRDYIASHLEVLVVETGHRKVLHSSSVPFEAPNWTPDGAALIYNSSGSDPATRGRLYRFDLATRTPTLIDTGFALRNNNDHVLSFDGSLQGISDQSMDAGESTIYVLPASGGVPQRVTPLTPSYLHGWSPDGQQLVYTGGREGNYDIYRIAADGSGTEFRLTTDPALDDGPEYSPDGQFIWFNSARSGRMQIWRMRPDGSEQQQVTDDNYNNWFPHPSPDGQWIAMISYVDEVAPSDHPYYKRVYLRLMPASGGTPKVIAYVYGGQGSINVPSWSPDGRQLAFVSNSASPTP